MTEPTENRSETHSRRPAESDPIASLLRSAGPPRDPDAERGQRVLAAVEEAWQRSVERRRARRRAVWGSLAAVLAAAVLVGWWVVPEWTARWTLGADSAPRRTTDGQPVAETRIATLLGAVGQVFDPQTGQPWALGADLSSGAGLTTGTGVRATLALGDGRSLRLDEHSRVLLEGPGQLRLLAGAVYVDSPPAAAHRPFAVLTPLGPVQEIGTRFEVRLLESGEADPRTEARQLSVRVRDGRVQVTRSLVDRLPAGAGEVVHEAVAGERLDLPATGEPIRRSALSPADPLWSWTWRAGVGFAIEGATLEEFLTWYRREAGRPVTLGKSPGARAPGDIVLHGSVTGLEPDDALAVVCRSAGWQARRQAEGWFLTP